MKNIFGFSFKSSIELNEALRLFFNEQTQILADETTQEAIQPFIEGQCEVQVLLDYWFNLVQVKSYKEIFVKTVKFLFY